MSVGKNIVKLRKIADMTQEELAQVAGVTRSAVSLWEIGDSEPRMGSIQQMADYFGLRKGCFIEFDGMANVVRSPGGRLYERQVQESDLSSEELELVRLYRSANAQGRATIIGVARLQSGVEGQLTDIAINE